MRAIKFEGDYKLHTVEGWPIEMAVRAGWLKGGLPESDVPLSPEYYDKDGLLKPEHYFNNAEYFLGSVGYGKTSSMLENQKHTIPFADKYVGQGRYQIEARFYDHDYCEMKERVKKKLTEEWEEMKRSDPSAPMPERLQKIDELELLPEEREELSQRIFYKDEEFLFSSNTVMRFLFRELLATPVGPDRGTTTVRRWAKLIRENTYKGSPRNNVRRKITFRWVLGDKQVIRDAEITRDIVYDLVAEYGLDYDFPELYDQFAKNGLIFPADAKPIDVVKSVLNMGDSNTIKIMEIEHQKAIDDAMKSKDFRTKVNILSQKLPRELAQKVCLYRQFRDELGLTPQEAMIVLNRHNRGAKLFYCPDHQPPQPTILRGSNY
ncbi:MAG TPA: hypothetical protein VD999_06660 [Vitreimonas sp.]|nr:hypothetical protein [Vitreimonas sp.]